MPPQYPLHIRLGHHDILLVPSHDVIDGWDRERATRLIEQSHVEPDEACELIEALLSGSHVVVRLDSPHRLLDGPKIVPLIDPDDPIVPGRDDPRPTWISLEVVHPAAVSTEGVEVVLSSAEGRDHHGRLDASGRWRCDAVARGSCEVVLLDHPSLRVRPRVVGPPTPIDGQLQWVVGKTRELSLATTAHHRIHLVQPRFLQFSV